MKYVSTRGSAPELGFADALLAVTASVQRRGNALVVLLSSIQPMNDPFIDVLVEPNVESLCRRRKT